MYFLLNKQTHKQVPEMRAAIQNVCIVSLERASIQVRLLVREFGITIQVGVQ